MNKSLMFKILLCLLVFGLCLYSYMDKQNELTSLKIELPKIAKEINDTKEEIKKMKYEIEMFESPAHLMELVRKPEFGHLKHPFVDDVLTLPQGVALKEENIIAN